MIRARFRLTLPPDVWVAELSSSFPDATFRLHTGVPQGDCVLEIGEIRADGPRAVADAMRSHPDIRDFESLHADDDRVIARYEADEQRLYDLLRESSRPPEFPLDVEDGRMEFDLTTTREQFEAFGSALDESGLSYDLLSVVEKDGDSTLLTGRQRECLTVALREGYFAVPRECTLAEVADELGVDTSTASETIRRGTARVVAQFLVGGP